MIPFTIEIKGRNEPIDAKEFEYIDRLIKEGKVSESISTPDYKGMETV